MTEQFTTTFKEQPKGTGTIGALDKRPYVEDSVGVFLLVQLKDLRPYAHLLEGVTRCDESEGPCGFQDLVQYPHTGFESLLLTDLSFYRQVFVTPSGEAGIVYLEARNENLLLEEEPRVGARTLQELVKMIDEWAHLPGDTPHQTAAMRVWEALGLSEEATELLRTNIPNQAPARFVAGDASARERSPSVPALSEDPLEKELAGAILFQEYTPNIQSLPRTVVERNRELYPGQKAPDV